jgi:hypothetical protein
MALTFATRYEATPVLVGITVATAIVHAISVIVGGAVGAAIPTRSPSWQLSRSWPSSCGPEWGDELTAEDEARAAGVSNGAAQGGGERTAPGDDLCDNAPPNGEGKPCFSSRAC